MSINLKCAQSKNFKTIYLQKAVQERFAMRLVINFRISKLCAPI